MGPEGPRAIVRDGRRWLAFGAPRGVLVAPRPDEAWDALREAWAQVAGGRWAVGALAYEAALGLGLAVRVSAAEGPPAAAFLLFDEPRVVDRLRTGPFDSRAPLDWQPGLDAAGHARGVERVQKHIAAGDTYQVNLMFPLLASGLLPGTLRGRLLAERRVRERVVRLDELKGRRIWLVNSVRGWQAAELVDDLPSPEVR